MTHLHIEDLVIRVSDEEKEFLLVERVDSIRFGERLLRLVSQRNFDERGRLSIVLGILKINKKKLHRDHFGEQTVSTVIGHKWVIKWVLGYKMGAVFTVTFAMTKQDMKPCVGYQIFFSYSKKNSKVAPTGGTPDQRLRV